MSKELPNKLSQLLRIAVKDAQKCSKSRKYMLDMSQWHAGRVNSYDTCQVCMAGAVMAQTLKSDCNISYIPEDFGDSANKKLGCINSMRSGCINEAYRELTEKFTSDLLVSQRNAISRANEVIFDSYKDSKDRATWKAYIKAANILSRAGL